jgi:predicted CXXCH cytochrome family protein
MKRFASLMFSAAFLLAGAGSAWAQGNITGSKHDFQSATWNSTGEICVVCHAAHNPDPGASDGVPLWNHDITTQTFTLYSDAGNNTLDASDIAQPAGVSKLCLSCHDGTVALDSFGGNTGSTNISGATLVGTDLSNDHPVSFTYNTALATADGALWNPSDAGHTTALGGTIQADLLFSDKLECGSCHDVHNNGLGSTALLRIDNAASALCLTCHQK